MSRRITTVLAFSLALSCSFRALAESAPPPPAPASTPDEEPEPSEEDKAEAKRQFQKGVELMLEQAYAPALAAYKRSRELYPRKGVMMNMAVCLDKLQRYDEAFDVYTQVLRDFPDLLKPEEKKVAQEFVAKMGSRVGTIEIVGAEIGAGITVDGQTKGEFPSPSPVRVAAGRHTVRLYKEGFEAFEDQIDVNGGESRRVEVKLRPLQDSGKLRVIEQSGRTMDVFVDGTNRGKTPWEARIDVGRHTITLAGPGNLGTQPVAAVVKPQETQVVPLHAEILDSVLRVNPTPGDAKVALDGVEIGIGNYFGRLKSGEHKIEIYQDGFIRETQSVTLEPGGRLERSPVLQRDRSAERWAKWTFEVDSGVPMVPNFGGDVADVSCGDGCDRSIGLGTLSRFIAGYEWGVGFGLGGEAGLFGAWQSVEGRQVSIVPKGLEPQSGTARDALRVVGVIAGLSVSYRFTGERLPLGVRLGAGVLYGNARDARDAHDFRSTQKGIGNASNVFVTQVPATAAYFYLHPEAYFGYRIGESFEIGGSLGALLFIPFKQPRFDATQPVTMDLSVDDPVSGARSRRKSYATFPAESLTGPLFVAIVPGLRARYDF